MLKCSIILQQPKLWPNILVGTKRGGRDEGGHLSQYGLEGIGLRFGTISGFALQVSGCPWASSGVMSLPHFKVSAWHPEGLQLQMLCCQLVTKFPFPMALLQLVLLQLLLHDGQDARRFAVLEMDCLFAGCFQQEAQKTSATHSATMIYALLEI